MKFYTALALAVGVHAAIGTGAALWLTYGRSAIALAKLDLSSVELSFAEEESESSPVVPMPPAPPLEAPRPEEIPPPQLPPVDELPPVPPEPDALKLPEPPPEAPPKMESPQPPQPEPPPEPQPKEERKSETRAQEQPPAPPSAPKQGRVDAPPSPKRTIKPDYPRLSRLRGEEGDVVLKMWVNAKGRVDEVEVVGSSGFEELDAAAVRAVRMAKFTPAKQGGRPVASAASILITFRLK